MDQGLVQALVGFGEIDVFTGYGNGHPVLGILDVVDQIFPGFDIGLTGPDVEEFENFGVQTFLVEIERQFVDRLDINAGDDRIFRDVAEQGDLGLQAVFEGDLGTADQDVGLDTIGPQFPHRVLGWFGLHLAGCLDIGHQGEVDEQRVFPAEIGAELADRLDKGQTFDIADRAADLDDGHIGAAVELEDGGLDFIGDMGDDLNRAAEIFTAPFLGNHRIVDATGGVVVLLGHDGVGEALVVAHVQIGLGPVIGDVDLAVLEGVHGARIDVDIGVEFLEGDGEPPAFEQCTDTGCCKPFAERGKDTAGDENELGPFGGM